MRVLTRAFAAAQFFILDEFIAEFIPVPFIDELLTPIIFFLDRRIWATSQAIIISRNLFSVPREINNIQSTYAPIYQNCFGSWFQNATATARQQAPLLWNLIDFIITPNGLVITLLATVALVPVMAYAGSWFWGGMIDHWLRVRYGWMLSQPRDFKLWRGLAVKSRPLLRVDRRIRRFFHADKIQTFWVFYFYTLLGMGIFLLGIAPFFIYNLLTGHFHPSQSSGFSLPGIPCIPR